MDIKAIDADVTKMVVVSMPQHCAELSTKLLAATSFLRISLVRKFWYVT